VRVLLLSIIAKCGVFTHVRELALYMRELGIEPVIGLIHNAKTTSMFKLTETDINAMIQSFNDLSYILYDSDENLLEQISSLQIDLVHAHSPLVFETSLKVSKKLDIPFVITLHSVLNWGKLYPIAMKEAKCIIAIGPEVAKSAGKVYRNKVQIIFNGIDIEHYKPDNSSLPYGPLRIIWMGRTNGAAARGVIYLASAICILKQNGIPIEAKVVGHAVDASTKGMEDCGWVHDPLPHLHWGNIVFARGRALREAMACGNVGFMIGQGYGGIVEPEWFLNNKQPQLSGSLKHGCAKLNVLKIYKDILYFHKHRYALDRARKIARKIAEENFDVKKMVEQTYSVYQTAIQLHSNKQNS
jgi:hypothetical protein